VERYVLKLYIAGISQEITQMIDRLQQVCDDEFSGCYKLVVVDVLSDPEQAEQDRIIATPSLIKELPPPLRRVIGDLKDADRALLGLGLKPAGRQLHAEPSTEEH
jgi:circadian clock protein KaiB